MEGRLDPISYSPDGSKSIFYWPFIDQIRVPPVKSHIRWFFSVTTSIFKTQFCYYYFLDRKLNRLYYSIQGAIIRVLTQYYDFFFPAKYE